MLNAFGIHLISHSLEKILYFEKLEWNMLLSVEKHLFSLVRICHVIGHLEADIIKARMQYFFRKEA